VGEAVQLVVCLQSDFGGGGGSAHRHSYSDIQLTVTGDEPERVEELLFWWRRNFVLREHSGSVPMLRLVQHGILCREQRIYFPAVSIVFWIVRQRRPTR
jgi:hypothetical protein